MAEQLKIKKKPPKKKENKTPLVDLGEENLDDEKPSDLSTRKKTLKHISESNLKEKPLSSEPPNKTPSSQEDLQHKEVLSPKEHEKKEREHNKESFPDETVDPDLFPPFSPEELEPLSKNNKEDEKKTLGKDENSQQNLLSQEEQKSSHIYNAFHSQYDPITLGKEEYNALSPLKKEILKIAEDVLKKKKYKPILTLESSYLMSPLMESLVQKCVAKLTHTKGYSREEIIQAIKELEEDYWIVSHQRRTKKEILENPLMQNILEFIRKHPGIHARDPLIEKELKITRNPFIKHSLVLESFNLIRTKRIGKRLNYFLATVPEIFDDLVVMFQNPLVVKIIYAFLENKDISIAELARKLNVYHGAIQYHIKHLIEQGILIKQGKQLKVNKALLKRYNLLFEYPPFNL